MPNIFISHSTKDNDKTRQITNMLKDAGFDVWVDFDSIRDGTRWVREIEAGIDGADAVVVVWSKSAQQSEWVEKECLYTFNLQKPMFIALIEPARLRLYVVNIQYTDCTTDLAGGMKDLIGAIQHTLNNELTIVNYPVEKVSPNPTEDNFFEYVEQLPDGDAAMWVAKDLYLWAQHNTDEIEFGGSKNPAYHAKVDLDDKQVTVFSIWAYPKTPSTQIPLDYFSTIAPFDKQSQRIAVLNKMNDLLPANQHFTDDNADRRPTLPLQYLSTAEKLEGYKQIIADIINNLRTK